MIWLFFKFKSCQKKIKFIYFKFGSLTFKKIPNNFKISFNKYSGTDCPYPIIKFVASNKIPWSALFLFTDFVTSVLLIIFFNTSTNVLFMLGSSGKGKNYKIFSNLTYNQGLGVW